MGRAGPRLVPLTGPLAALLALCVASVGHAEDAVSLSGNYYLERSTRVIEPIFRVSKDLPSDSELAVEYLVDQITSASAAFTANDEPFSEFRHEVRLDAKTKWFGFFTTGAGFRYSTEPDYDSVGFSASLGLSLLDDTLSFSTYVQHAADEVRQRNRAGFLDTLSTTMLGLSYSQILRPNLVVGLTAETQILSGYQENPYRAEVHPRDRLRWSFSGFVASRYVPWGLGAKATYRFYVDDWELRAHTVDLELTQRLLEGLELAPRIRYHTQDGVFFTDLAMGQFITRDPKLQAFGSMSYGLRVSWQQRWLRGTPLDLFADSWVEPYYMYVDQDTTYGPAHLAQLNWYWPF